MQFGHARPGETAHYTDLLFNHVQTDTTVNLEAASLWQGWNVSVNPSTTTALPGYANLIHIAVNVPMNPAHRIDVERVRAVTATDDPYTTTAHLITIECQPKQAGKLNATLTVETNNPKGGKSTFIVQATAVP